MGVWGFLCLVRYVLFCNFLRFKTLKIGNFCTLNEKWLIPGTHLASKKLRRNTLFA